MLGTFGLFKMISCVFMAITLIEASQGQRWMWGLRSCALWKHLGLVYMRDGMSCMGPGHNYMVSVQ